MTPTEHVFETPLELAKATAELVRSIGQKTIDATGRFSLVLSGGSTPAATYRELASLKLDWSKTHLFWGDERPVISTHPDSNYRLAFENLIKHITIPPANVHRVASEEDSMLAAQQYQDEIYEFFGVSEGSFPSFDLILLGLGDDGHTASLFPGSHALDESSNLVVENYVKKLNTRRITFTLPLINAAKNVVFVVSGESKQNAVHQVLREAGGEPVPAKKVKPLNGSLFWYLDKSAAVGLK